MRKGRERKNATRKVTLESKDKYNEGEGNTERGRRGKIKGLE